MPEALVAQQEACAGAHPTLACRRILVAQLHQGSREQRNAHMATITKKLSLASVALALSSAGAFAQAPPTMPQPSAGPPAAVVVPPNIPWHTFEVIERRYKIEALRFKALDETGIDWWGSDEVMVETTDAKGWTVSNEIGDIDSGDTHTFDPAKSCIVSVRPGVVVLGKTSVCDAAGEPAPLGFQVKFWEKDWSLFG